jgi:polar amino acid transport system substrate-binding protein
VIDPAPLPPTEVGVGGLMLEKNTFLRSAMDEAIAALRADGTIQSILDKYKYPASAKP